MRPGLDYTSAMSQLLVILLLVASAQANGPDTQTPQSSVDANAKGAARGRPDGNKNKSLSWSYNEQGTAAAYDGKREAALKLFTKAVDADPNNGIAQQNLGRALWHFNRYDEAETHTLIGLRLEPGIAAPYQVMVWQRRRQGRFEEALDFARKGRALDPGYNDGFFVNKEIHLLNCLERYDEAFRIAGEPAPLDTCFMMYERARASLHSNHAAEALAEARRFRACPANVIPQRVSHGLAGEALVALGRLDEAALEGPLSGDEEEPFLLGLIARDRGNTTEAIRQLTKARGIFASSQSKRNGARRCGKNWVQFTDAAIAKLGMKK